MSRPPPLCIDCLDEGCPSCRRAKDTGARPAPASRSYVASCGARFCSDEERQQHERTCRAAPPTGGPQAARSEAPSADVADLLRRLDAWLLDPVSDVDTQQLLREARTELERRYGITR